MTILVHLTEINLLYTVTLQIFRDIDLPFIEFKKYLLQNWKTGQVIAWINEKFSKITAINVNLK